MNKMGNLLMKAGAIVLTAACAFTPVAGTMASATSVMASDIRVDENVRPLPDTIDPNAKGAIDLYKYDFTAAQKDGVLTGYHNDSTNDNYYVDINGHSIKITGERNDEVERYLDNYRIKGVEFTYAKVADIETLSENGKVKVVYRLPSTLSTRLGLPTNKPLDSTEISKALEAKLADNRTSIRATLEDYMAGNDSQRNTMMTDANGHAAATNLPVGLYLIIETKVPANVKTTVDPFFVTIPMTDVNGDGWMYNLTLYPKNQTDYPTIDKQVRQNDDAVINGKPAYGDTATGSAGDKMDYKVIAKIPEIDSKATWLQAYKFTDKIDHGLTYNKDTTIKFYKSKSDAEAGDVNKDDNVVATWDKNSSKFSATYSGITSDSHGMVITMTDSGLSEINPQVDRTGDNADNTIDPPLTGGYGGMYMVVYYSVTVSSDQKTILGDVGNTNDIHLDWKRTNADEWDHLEDRARVFTYGINLTKEFSDPPEGRPAPDKTKAQFVLQNKTDGHYVTAKNPAPGVYWVTDATKTHPADTNAAQKDESTLKFSPDSSGRLMIYGLEADEYVITEVKTAEGYALLKGPITVRINATQDDIIESITYHYDRDEQGKIVGTKRHKITDNRKKDADAAVDGSVTKMSSTTPVGGVVSANSLVDMTVTNTPSFNLPMTGGVGTILFTLGGCALAVVGIAVVTGKRKKAE